MIQRGGEGKKRREVEGDGGYGKKMRENEELR
jgi:hypothetical protein